MVLQQEKNNSRRTQCTTHHPLVRATTHKGNPPNRKEVIEPVILNQNLNWEHFFSSTKNQRLMRGATHVLAIEERISKQQIVTGLFSIHVKKSRKRINWAQKILEKISLASNWWEKFCEAAQTLLCFARKKAFFSRLAPTLICFANSVGFNTVASPLEILRWKTSSWRGKSKWFISGIYKRKVKNVVVCLFFTLYDNGVSVSEIWRPNWWSWWCFWWRSAIFDLFPSVVLLICRTSLDPHFPSKICSDKEIRKYCLRENQSFYYFSKLLQKAQQDTIRVGFVHLQLKISSCTFLAKKK